MQATPPAADPHGTGEGGADYQGALVVAPPPRPAAPCVPLDKADCDKEWAALTTWIRMNLHQPRTQKRVVLFVGCWVEASGRWVFNLNQELTWDDVGAETKLRLRTLPEETVRVPALPGLAWPGRCPDSVSRPAMAWAAVSRGTPGTSQVAHAPLQ